MDLARLQDVAATTCGVFTPAMAKAAGISAHQFGRLRRRGAISHICGHGYLMGQAVPTVEQRAIAACLTWPDAIVCLHTAALLLGLPVTDDGSTHVLVPNGRHPIMGLTTHYWSVGPAGIERRGGWVMTDRLTTLADLLGRLPEREAWGLFAWLATRDLITVADVRAQLADRKHLYGVVRLREMADALERGAVSPAEVKLHDFLEKHDFRGWGGNEKIYRGRLIVARADILFYKERVIVEFDGLLAHPKHKAKDDEARHEMLEQLGYHVVHVRWERLINESWELAAELRAALVARAA